MTTAQYVDHLNSLLYCHKSAFTAEEQAAMKRGYTMAERRKISGRVFGIYPQAISEDHARKLDRVNFGE